MITIYQFKKVEIKVGLVTEAVNKGGSDKLIRLTVDVGEEQKRIIFTGVRPFGFEADYFLNKKFLFITNLEYRKMLDEESQGMILAVGEADGKPVFISAEGMDIGAKVR